MRAVFDIKTLVLLALPVVVTVVDLMVVPLFVPQVSLDKPIKWAAMFKRTEKALVLTKTVLPEISISKAIFGIQERQKTRPKKQVLTKETPPRRREKHWDLRMVIIGPKKRIALLNGIIVTEGSVIDGFLVKEIGRRHVVLVNNGQIKRVFLKRGG